MVYSSGGKMGKNVKGKNWKKKYLKDYGDTEGAIEAR